MNAACATPLVLATATLLSLRAFAQPLERAGEGWRTSRGGELRISGNGKFFLEGGDESQRARQIWRDEDGATAGSVIAAESNARPVMWSGDAKAIIYFTPLEVAYSDGSGASAKIPVFIHRHIIGGAESDIAVSVPPSATPLAVDPTGKRVVISASAGGRIAQAWIIDMDENGKKLKLSGAAGDTIPADGVAFSPDGTRLVLSVWDKTHVWNTETGAKVLDLPWPAKPATTRRLMFPHSQFAATWSADGSTVAVIGNAGVAVWRLDSPKKGTWLKAAADDLIFVALSPNGSHAYAATEGGALERWTVANAGYGKLNPSGTERITGWAVSEDGKNLMTAGFEKNRSFSAVQKTNVAGTYVRHWRLPDLVPASPEQAPETTPATTRSVEFRELLDKAKFGGKPRALTNLNGGVAFFSEAKNPLEQEYLEWLPKDVQALAASDPTLVHYLVIFEERRLAAGMATYKSPDGQSVIFWGHQPQWRFRVIPTESPTQGVSSEWMTGNKPEFPKSLTKPPPGQQTMADMLNNRIGRGPLEETSAFFRRLNGGK